MTKIRIITPIITTGFRNNVPLATAAPMGCDLSFAFLTNGPASIESSIDEVLAAPGVIDAALKAQADGMDAVIIDCMLDPGLDAAREAVEIPVIGCGEASLREASKFGRFSVLTVLDRQKRAFRKQAACHGLSDQLASVRGIGIPVLDLERDREASIDATIRESRGAVNDDGARVIIFGCTGMLGFAEPVYQALGPEIDLVIDPLPHAIAVAHAAVSENDKTDKLLYPRPDPKPVLGFSSWISLSNVLGDKR